jgi:hypothetical protein
MTWNYRIVKQDNIYELCEVYYDQLGKPMGYCSSKPIGDSAEELQSVLDMMSEGCSRPIFDAKDFKC